MVVAERAHRGAVPSSMKVAAPSLPGGVEGHAVAGGELANSHEVVKGGIGRRPYCGAQGGRGVER